MESKRNNNLDLLRTIGLLGVILAHVSPPDIVMQLRTFDVPLMVFVSGIAYGISNDNQSASVLYYRHRLLRLLAPTWTFLLVFFSYFWIVDIVTNDHYITSYLIINSLFLRGGGIGYLWIIKVFLLVAISSPIIQYVNKRIQNNFIYYFFICMLLILYFYLTDIKIANNIEFQNSLFRILVNEYLFYIIPYSLIFAVGLRISILPKNQIIILFLFTLISYVFVSRINVENVFSNINAFKYPPQSFWTIYGLMISILLYLFLTYGNMHLQFHKLIFFMSSSSMWIYLWHIFLLKNWNHGTGHIPDFAKNYFVKFLVLTVLASLITYLQKKGFHFLIAKYEKHHFIYRVISVCFLK
ncbi:putative O-actetyl transferase [Desulforapulum autotrophicum HRM2]|uniref:O-actetyl transferase n=1 Tax=Desulforapulum autotrophicum (strain ATCC 43914 / DSM 3382 / VKM B-1955 / HRM2) TaxID=177437 RepID=C0QCL1_DESAH|nr:putative O-actetyl transferase [Desulforapulum autotrophicum HRM2]